MKKQLSSEEKSSLLATLKTRFETNIKRHPKMDWAAIATKLEQQPNLLWTLQQMETTGGEPDVVDYDKASNEYIFMDCAAQSPAGRRSLCYDHVALESRKENKPKNSAMQMASEMGATVIDEAQYRKLQELGEFDTKTSSWLNTPPAIRKLGGAIFGDFRFNTTFIYHNGAESYYAGRAFRCMLRV